MTRIPPARSPVAAGSVVRALPGIAGGGDASLRLAALLRTRYRAAEATLVGGGTDALRMALDLALARSPGAAVLLPAYTCYEVATAAVGARAPVALYDVDPTTLEPDWHSVRARARSRVGALVVAPLYGSIVDWTEARRVADDLGGPLIEDAAQAFGATWGDAPVGAAGDMSILSFGRGKGWSGAGGGALLRRGEWASRSLPPIQRQSRWTEMKTAAAAAAQVALSDPAVYSIPASMPFLRLGETVYHEPTPPVCMTEVSARLVLEGAQRSDAEADERRRNAEEYLAGVERLGIATGRWHGTDARAGALRFPVRLRGGWGATVRGPLPALGAGPPYPTTLAALPALAGLLVDTPRLPGAETLVAELVTLPTHARTTSVSRRKVMDWLLTSEPVAHTQRPGPAADVVAT